MADLHALQPSQHSSAGGVADGAAGYELIERGAVDPARSAAGFESVSLGDVAHIEMGQSPDSRHVSENMDVGVPFLQGNAEFGALSPQPKFSCTSPTKLSETGDLLISVRAPVGEINRSDRVYCIGRGLAAVRLSTVPTSLAIQVVAAATPSLRRVAQGTTFEAINKSDLCSLCVCLPPENERHMLTKIIDTIDTAIRQTEAVIAKLKQVKQGLLHDLLTRGIDANGELRPPQSHAPRLYKPSPLGWIPKDWECLPLGELAESMVDGPFGSNLKTAHYVENPGVRVVRLQNILPGEYDDSERAFISDRHAASLSRNRVVGGDALIASLGDARYPVGRSCCYPTGLPDAVNKADCFRFRSNARCGNAFVTLALNGATARRQVSGYEQGVTMKRINLGNLRRVEIALPAVTEQNLVVERVLAARRKIGAVTLEHEKLQKEKSGLMDDLLTGRVRVTPLLEAAATPWLHSERG